MIKTAALILAAIIFIMGIISAASAVLTAFFGGCASEIILIPVGGHMEDVEYRIRGAAVRRQRLKHGTPVIMVADFGADDETAEIARRVCSEYDAAEWVEYGKLNERLKKYV